MNFLENNYMISEWNTISSGKIFALQQSKRPNGELWERAVRSPGVRLIIRTNDNKFVLSKEHRNELGSEDYRLPGGKVFDTLDEYLEFLSSGKDIEEAAKNAAIKEASEEVGVIKPKQVKLVYKSVAGSTVKWDLYVFEVFDFEIADQNLKDSEVIEPVILSPSNVLGLINSANFNEDRMVPVLLRYFSKIDKDYWGKKHLKYKSQGLSDKPSKFLLETKGYIKSGDRVLELGCGAGQDTISIAEMGCQVVALDINIDLARKLYESKRIKGDITYEEADISEGIDSSAYGKFDVVYANLSLHYFKQNQTIKIFNDIYDILKPGGRLICMLNSKDDPEFNQGNKIQNDYFEVEGIAKRFFSDNSLKPYVANFETIILDSRGSSFKDDLKNTRNMIRFVGIKK
jgi:SAM-dependent methyltransferase